MSPRPRAPRAKAGAPTVARPPSLAALPCPPGETAADRRRALAALSDDALAGALVSLATSLRGLGAPALDALAREAGLPTGEVVASPFAVRMVAMAVATGATTVHGDLRQIVRWPAAWSGGEALEDEAHGAWEAGVLRRGKYQQFLEDEPFAEFHPDHVSKWGPHELMHRACGFFLRPGMSRWELYLGARLNELLPVVTWYAFEQAMRLDEGAFDRVEAARAPEAELAAARWLTDDDDALRARARAAVPRVREGLAHLERELAAIDEELASGRRVTVPHAFLDASSDALAYVAGHAARLDAMAPALARLVPAVAGRVDDVRAYRARIESIADALLFSPITLDAQDVAARRSGRAVWDVVQRALQCGGRVARIAEGLADEAGAAVAASCEGHVVDVAGWRARLREGLGRASQGVLATGGVAADEHALAQLGTGLATSSPRTAPPSRSPRLAAFAASQAPSRRAPLGVRWADFLATQGDSIGAGRARLEAAIARAARGDDRIERLTEAGPPPRDLASIRLVRSETFTRHAFDEDVVAWHANDDDATIARGPHVFLVGLVRGEVSIVSVPPFVEAALDALAAGPRDAMEFVTAIGADGRAWLDALVEAGVLGWFPALPAPRRRGLSTSR